MTGARAFAWVFIGVASAVLLVHAYQRFVPWSLAVVRTASVARGVYLAHPVDAERLQRGAVVCFRFVAPAWARERHYLPEGALACKELAGLPGDRVTTLDGVNLLESNGQTRELGRLLAVDREGRPSHALVYDGSPVPAGWYYLHSPHPRGLDSRYLGLIPQDRLVKVLTPLVFWDRPHG